MKTNEPTPEQLYDAVIMLRDFADKHHLQITMDSSMPPVVTDKTNPAARWYGMTELHELFTETTFSKKRRGLSFVSVFGWLG